MLSTFSIQIKEVYKIIKTNVDKNSVLNLKCACNEYWNKSIFTK